jgi:hypothetical protein
MKRLNAIIVPFNPNTPKKRRRKNTVNHKQALSFDVLDPPSSVPTNDENQLSRTLSSPWTPPTSISELGRLDNY